MFGFIEAIRRFFKELEEMPSHEELLKRLHDVDGYPQDCGSEEDL